MSEESQEFDEQLRKEKELEKKKVGVLINERKNFFRDMFFKEDVEETFNSIIKEQIKLINEMIDFLETNKVFLSYSIDNNWINKSYTQEFNDEKKFVANKIQELKQRKKELEESQ